MLNVSPEEQNRFRMALRFVLEKEQGYVNDPDDPGGETKYGIAKRFHPNEDIKNLLPSRAAEIYYEEYWIPAGCDVLPSPLCIVVFDTAVNMGVSQAVAYLKGSDWDIRKYLDQRKLGYAERAKKRPASQKYLKGWLNRVNDLDKYVTLIAQEQRTMMQA